MTNLIGSAKQVTWATKIRDEKLIEINKMLDMIADCLKNGKGNAEKLNLMTDLLNWMKNNKKAVFFINIRKTNIDVDFINRHASFSDDVLTAYKGYDFAHCMPTPID